MFTVERTLNWATCVEARVGTPATGSVTAGLELNALVCVPNGEGADLGAPSRDVKEVVVID